MIDIHFWLLAVCLSGDYLSLQTSCRCADDNPLKPSYKVSKNKARSLGIDFIPLETSLKETVECLKEKRFIRFWVSLEDQICSSSIECVKLCCYSCMILIDEFHGGMCWTVGQFQPSFWWPVLVPMLYLRVISFFFLWVGDFCNCMIEYNCW